VGRSSADAPQIDGVVKVAPHRSLKVGEFAMVRITASDAYDLQGEVETAAEVSPRKN
jgi:ribosomal protein S12 methylthiotransferase